MKEYWLISLFWEEHNDTKGLARFKGGYETKWIERNPSNLMVELIGKYGSIVTLVNALRIDKSQYDYADK